MMQWTATLVINYKYPKGSQIHRGRMEGKRGERLFLGRYSRTRVVIIAASAGVRRTGTIRRLGARRRWDAEGPAVVRRVTWGWVSDACVQPGVLRARCPPEESRRAECPSVGG